MTLWITMEKPADASDFDRVLLVITVGDVADEYESQTDGEWDYLTDTEKATIIDHAKRYISHLQVDFDGLVPR